MTFTIIWTFFIIHIWNRIQWVITITALIFIIIYTLKMSMYKFEYYLWKKNNLSLTFLILMNAFISSEPWKYFCYYYFFFSFNPIAMTNMKSAMKRVTSLMNKRFVSLYSVPSQECIDSIINSSMGDIRSAINNLHFTFLKGLLKLKYLN